MYVHACDFICSCECVLVCITHVCVCAYVRGGCICAVFVSVYVGMHSTVIAYINNAPDRSWSDVLVY